MQSEADRRWGGPVWPLFQMADHYHSVSKSISQRGLLPQEAPGTRRTGYSVRIAGAPTAWANDKRM